MWKAGKLAVAAQQLTPGTVIFHAAPADQSPGVAFMKSSVPHGTPDLDRQLSPFGGVLCRAAGHGVHGVGIFDNKRIQSEYMWTARRLRESAARSVLFRLNGRQRAAPVIFGEKQDNTLLGTVSLETLGVMLDPMKRELRPLPTLLAAHPI